MSKNLDQLPNDLPVPVDDGAADHLTGLRVPDVALTATDGTSVNLAALEERWVIYVYPMTGRPDTPLPVGWDKIPGARGCTPEACAFRDHFSELQSLNTGVYGLSTQTTEYQSEARNRLHLPFQLLSDHDDKLGNVLKLPAFNVDGMRLYKRLTLVINKSVIEKVFYPVFPPDTHAGDVLAWLRQNATDT